MGENLSAAFLSTNGYVIIHRNWHHSRYEIDIIATKDDTLHFIEVKSVSSDEQVYPENHVTSKKFLSIKKRRVRFLAQHKRYKHVQFDVLSVVIKKETSPEDHL